MKTRKNNGVPKLHIINGYKVLFVPRGKDILHVECVIRNGFCTETKYNSGINHLLEHVMVNAWKNCKTSCNAYWDNKGYSVNASTDKTTMNYYIKGLNTEWKNMITYIASIIDHPMITHESLKKEKQAVIDELLTFSNDPESEVQHMFNMHFYKTDGLKYTDDWKLQIDNLKRLSLEDIYTIYNENFNIQNMLFVVMGDFNLSAVKTLLQKHLKQPKNGKIQSIECFSYHHEILFSKQNIENTKILLGFPSSDIHNYIYIQSILSLLHILFFNEFRTKKSLVYDIEVFSDLNACGTTIYIEFDVQTNHVEKVLIALFKYIRFLQKTPVTNLDGFKNQEIYKYITNKNSVMNYYTSLIYSDGPLHKKEQIINDIKKITSREIMQIVQQIFQIDKSLCVYQCKKNLHLTWEKLI
jgi:predicted Zn-dependent peptidase